MTPKLALAVICFALGASAFAHAGPLHDAAKAGDITQIEFLLSQGADIDQSNGLATPLYYAIHEGHEDAAILLIKRGADVNRMSIWGTPLHAAATVGAARAAGWLLGYGADPSAPWNQLTPLHVAARDGHIEVVRILLDYGSDLNALTALEQPPLHWALLNGHADVADLLRARGARAPQVEEIDSFLVFADPERGRALAFACWGCHTTDRSKTALCGPPLWDIVEQPKAQGKFPFSPALKAIGGTWTYDDLNAFLAQPAWTVPGTAMKMHGVHDPRDRADVIAFLRTLSDHPAPLP